MPIDHDSLRNMIRCLIRDGENHREAVFREINRTFIDSAFEFFRTVVDAKLRGEDLGEADWYRSELIEKSGLAKEAVAKHAGMPNKTIQNAYGTTRREVVLDASLRNYESLRRTIDELVAQRDNPSIILTIKLGAVGVDLTLNESLIVINSLAIQRERIRGGQWSSAGKQLERPLMVTLCLLYGVEERHWRLSGPNDANYQVDFLLRSGDQDYPCEVKLMGRGNPESAKAVHAQESRLLVADHLSEQAVETLNRAGIEWVRLAEQGGYRRFGRVLDRFNIARREPVDLSQLDEIIERAIERTAR